MVEEAVDAGFAEAGELLAEIDEFADRGVRVVIGALDRCLRAKDVGDQCSVSRFLVCHKFDEEAVLGGESCSFEICDGELGKPVMEEIELNPFLVQGQGLGIVNECLGGNGRATYQGLVVKVALRIIYWLGTVGSKATSGSVGGWLWCV